MAEKKDKGRVGAGRAGWSKKATPAAKGKAPGTARYDLGVPGLAARCVIDLYRSTGVNVATVDRLFILSAVTGVLAGFLMGYHPSGALFGPIGAALGVVFGLMGGLAVGAFSHWGLGSWLRPEAKALQLIRAGRMRSASDMFRRARRWIMSDRSGRGRLAGMLLHSLGLGRADLPPDIARANIEASQGVMAESVGDGMAAAEAYIKALEHWPRHGFALFSLLDLVIKDEIWEMEEEVKALTERFIEKARDKTLERAAREYLSMMKPPPKPPREPTIYRIKEDDGLPEGYRKGPSQTCKIIENPGSQISNGTLVIQDASGEKSVKLPPMPFQLMMRLAEAMRSDASEEPEQKGWVSINDLLATLPWTTPNVTNSNVHKLVYKLRNILERHDMDRSFIEENLNGCYRIALAPERIHVERVAAA